MLIRINFRSVYLLSFLMSPAKYRTDEEDLRKGEKGSGLRTPTPSPLPDYKNTYILTVRSFPPLAPPQPIGHQSTAKTSSAWPGKSIDKARLLKSHTLHVESLEAERRRRESGENATWYTAPTWPRRVVMNLNDGGGGRKVKWEVGGEYEDLNVNKQLFQPLHTAQLTSH